MQSAEDVEYWRGAEKSGWMYSQGEVIKTWRRRWFVLKKGFLFRFADQNVDAISKPRGIVDLTNVQDVADGRDATSKPNSIKLSTARGQVRSCCCDVSSSRLVFSPPSCSACMLERVRAFCQHPICTRALLRAGDWLMPGFLA